MIQVPNERHTLAVVGYIKLLTPIVGADNIRFAEVDCGKHGIWHGVVPQTIECADKVLVFFHDAILPQDDRWAFMEKYDWRVRLHRFKGCNSECVIVKWPHNNELFEDLTEELQIKKYEKQLPIEMEGEISDYFPIILPKTKETHIHKITNLYETMNGPFYLTEKADGVSCTAWVTTNGVRKVASRNYTLACPAKGSKPNIYWEAAEKYIFPYLTNCQAVQFEIVGPGINGNNMGLQGIEVRCFSFFTGARNHLRWQQESIWSDLATTFRQQNLLATPVLLDDEVSTYPFYNRSKLQEIADNLKYKNGAPAEGIIVRAQNQSWSFKVLSCNYKH